MRLSRLPVTHPSRSPRTIAVWLILLALCSALPAAAQTGVIAFRDHCTNSLHVMRGDGTGPTALQLPPLPLPAADYRYVDPWVLDVTTGGPLTVLYYVGIARRDSGALTNSGLFAVQVSDVGGRLVSGSPRRLLMPATVGGVEPKFSRFGAFSSPEVRDRLALAVPRGQTGRVFMTAKVDRDANRAITGLSDFVVLGDFASLGQASPYIDYASDGSSIVLSISSDLHRVHLAADNTMFGAAELLTPNTEGFAEWNPSYSPDGSRLAYTAGAIVRSGGVSGTSMQISSLNLLTRVFTRVTTNQNKGQAASGLDNAMWSADGTWIGFSAFTGSTPRRAPCSTLVNSEIFRIKADGTGVASGLTTTNGTGVEAWPQWGW